MFPDQRSYVRRLDKGDFTAMSVELTSMRFSILFCASDTAESISTNAVIRHPFRQLDIAASLPCTS